VGEPNIMGGYSVQPPCDTTTQQHTHARCICACMQATTLSWPSLSNFNSIEVQISPINLAMRWRPARLE
jgi:hypothetical protein